MFRKKMYAWEQLGLTIKRVNALLSTYKRAGSRRSERTKEGSRFFSFSPPFLSLSLFLLFFSLDDRKFLDARFSNLWNPPPSSDRRVHERTTHVYGQDFSCQKTISLPDNVRCRDADTNGHHSLSLSLSLSDEPSIILKYYFERVIARNEGVK